ncbi:BadF/BadG/BcrA/BcrD ATPase family protein [Thalassotalea sediminis]|uniref:BadF/BadG/BcrA/BcrD ATPase family protein n=1 Tax=Thalassotalea sediminis TaxID=1759089 RepID=UPI00257454A0|nr:BadF/BadG/BcrA/BcrD ATPase family protein [Thalassotalea sediminis]
MNLIKNDPDYILGIDGGGTKTIARLQRLGTEQQWQVRGGASSLTNDFELALRTCESLIEQLLTLSGARREQISIVIGLAGAGNKDKSDKFTHQLAKDFRCFELCTDAKTSLYGANAGQPVAMISLGTGSVGATLTDNGHSALKGGWGFTIGDEGSGAKLGVLIIQSILAELEANNEIVSSLGKALCHKISAGRDKLIQWSTTAKPIDFASIAPLAFELNDECPTAKAVLAQHVKNVERLITKTRGDLQLPVVLLGGLAEPTKPYLTPSILALLIPPKGNALDGACFLAEQLINKKNKENT